MNNRLLVLTMFSVILVASTVSDVRAAYDYDEYLGIIFNVDNITQQITQTVQGSSVSKWVNGTNEIYTNDTFSENARINGSLNVDGTTTNSSYAGDVQINGTLYGGSDLIVGSVLNVTQKIVGQEQLRLEHTVAFVNDTDTDIFSIYLANSTKPWSYAPSAFDNALIFETDRIANGDFMEICFWDNETQKMIMCLNQGAPGRATTVRRSLQVVGNTSVKENDENYTLCENANYVDCSTDVTGADFLVQDDIEAQSIYANEDMVAVSMNAINMFADFVSATNMTATDLYIGTIYANLISATTVVSTLLISATLVSAGTILTTTLNVSGNFKANHYYGFMNISDKSFTVTVSSKDVWYNVTGYNLTNSNGFVSATNGMKTIVSGLYDIDYSSSFICTANTQYAYTVFVNYLPKEECLSRASVGVPNEAENVASGCYLSLNENDIVSLGVMNLDSTANPTTKDSMLKLMRIGD